jgi:hypothetical protein
MPKENTITFQKFWYVISTVLAVTSFSSLSEGWVQWSDLILNVIQSFRNLTHPIWDFLLGWLPIEIPGAFKDYLSFGMIWSSSFFKGFLDISCLGLPGKNYFENVIGFLVMGISWPYFWLWLLKPKLVSNNPLNNRNRPIYILLRQMVQKWLAINVICFVLLLIVNYTFLMPLKFPPLF